MSSVHPRIGLNHQGFHDFLVFDSFAWNDNLKIVKKNSNNVTKTICFEANSTGKKKVGLTWLTNGIQFTVKLSYDRLTKFQHIKGQSISE